MPTAYTLFMKAAFTGLRPLIALYFRVWPTRRSRIIVQDSAGRILLVRGAFSRQTWELPGGGIGPKEDIATAAAREVREEADIRLDADTLTHVGTYLHSEAATPYRAVVFTCRLSSQPQPRIVRPLEILEVAWWPLEALPPPARLNSFVRPALQYAGLVPKDAS